MNKRTKSTALTVVERAVLAIGISAEDEAKLTELAKASEHITSITNDDGRLQVHSARMALKNQRVEIKKRGELAREDATAYSKAVIATEKRLVALIEPEEERLEGLQDAWDDAKEAEKQAAIEAEQRRAEALQERVAELRGNQSLSRLTEPDLIAEHISDLERIPVDDSFEEFREQAVAAKADGLARLRDLHTDAVAYRAEQEQIRKDREELERLRARQDAIKAEEDRLAAERAEFERQQAAARYVPPQRQPAAWFRDNEVTRDLLSLTGEGQCVPLSAIWQWTDEQCKQAEEWAGAAHLHASDNDDVIVPPIPTHVAVWDTPEARERIAREEDAFWGRTVAQPAEPPPAETIVLQTPRPTDAEIIAMIASHWGISEARAIEWVLSIDFSALEKAAMSTGSRDYNMSGILGSNKRREKDTHPTHTGQCTIDGKQYWISAWVKDGRDGSRYFSLSFKPKLAQEHQGAPRNPPPKTTTSNPPRRREPESSVDEFNDEITF